MYHSCSVQYCLIYDVALSIINFCIQTHLIRDAAIGLNDIKLDKDQTQHIAVRTNAHTFANDIFIFLCATCCVLIPNLLKFISKAPADTKLALVQVATWLCSEEGLKNMGCFYVLKYRYLDGCAPAIVLFCEGIEMRNRSTMEAYYVWYKMITEIVGTSVICSS